MWDNAGTGTGGEEMYYYSRKSTRKVVHRMNCHYKRKINGAAIGTFYTLKEAAEAGYRLCHHCSEIRRQYRKEELEIQRFCREFYSSCRPEGEAIEIETLYSRWKIIKSRAGKMDIYHKNTIKSKGIDTGIPG